MSRMETGWDWLHLWPRHSCPAPRVSPGTHHPSELGGNCGPEGTDLLIGLVARGGLCLKAGAQPPLGTWDTKRGGWQSERAAGTAASPEPSRAKPRGCTLQDIPRGGTLVQRDRSSTLGGAVHLTGVAPGAGAQGGGGTAVCPSGRCVGILGSRWQCATTCSYVGVCASSCPVAGSPARSISPGISTPGGVGTPAHPPTPGCPHRSFLCLATVPGAAPSSPEPQGTLPIRAQWVMPPRPGPSEALCPRAARCSGCPAVQMAPPPRRVAASTLTCGCFLCPFSLRLGLSSSLPPLRRPRPPVQPPPEPATHTSELFCVFQQLKRIKQQLSPGRAWILVTLIFCVAGQGEWGY